MDINISAALLQVYLALSTTAILLLVSDRIIYRVLEYKRLLSTLEILRGTLLDTPPFVPAVYRNEPWFIELADESKQVFQQPEWRPYVTWRCKRFQSKYLNVNRQGLRVTPCTAEQGARILVFGGSAVWGWGAGDAHTTSAQ